MSDLYENQSLVLSNSIDTNTLITYSSVASLNKKLITNEKKSLIKAINELFVSISSINTSSISLISDIKNVLGDIDNQDIINLFQNISSFGSSMIDIVYTFLITVNSDISDIDSKNIGIHDKFLEIRNFESPDDVQIESSIQNITMNNNTTIILNDTRTNKKYMVAKNNDKYYYKELQIL
mgnify:FL=1